MFSDDPLSVSSIINNEPGEANFDYDVKNTISILSDINNTVHMNLVNLEQIRHQVDSPNLSQVHVGLDKLTSLYRQSLLVIPKSIEKLSELKNYENQSTDVVRKDLIIAQLESQLIKLRNQHAADKRTIQEFMEQNETLTKRLAQYNLKSDTESMQSTEEASSGTDQLASSKDPKPPPLAPRPERFHLEEKVASDTEEVDYSDVFHLKSDPETFEEAQRTDKDAVMVEKMIETIEKRKRDKARKIPPLEDLHEKLQVLPPLNFLPELVSRVMKKRTTTI